MKLEALRKKFPFFILAIVFALGGCTVKLVASYDEVTDKSVTSLQKKVETFLVGLESKDGLPECSYENNVKFYEEAKVDLSAIQVRAAAIPKNELTNQQIKLLRDSLDSLELLHKLKDKKSKEKDSLQCISKDEVEPLRIAFNSSFTAILKLELAKKRGEG